MLTHKEIVAKAKENLEGQWGTAVVGGMLFIFLSSMANASAFVYQIALNLGGQLESNPVAIGIITILGLLLLSIVSVGYCDMNRRMADGEQLKLETMFGGFSYAGKCIWLNLVMAFFIFLWSLLLIIPGIIASYRYMMAPYILAENPEISAMEAINRSKKMMDGHKAELFVLLLSLIGWAVLAILTCGIGLLFFVPYREAIMGQYYVSLRDSQNTITKAEAVAETTVEQG